MSLVLPKIGILGGGQLARMLVQEGAKMGFEMHVLSSSTQDPAAQVTPHWTKGDTNSPDAVAAWSNKVDIITIESEFVAESAFQRVTKPVHPSAALLAEFSDRLSQKHWLERHDIATSPFSEIRGKTDVYAFLNSLGKKKQMPGVVMKKRRFGYDGYGTFILHDKKAVDVWLEEQKADLGSFIIEKRQIFQRELAFQVALNARGDSFILPLVEWQAADAKCLWVKGPVHHPSFGKLQKKIVKALKSSAYIGVFAVELFATTQGLVVNEVAPRVHNSGHHSLESMPLNQFGAHLRAIAGLRLPTQVKANAGGFAMLNLLGLENPIASYQPGVFLHWYGKTEVRAGRKMGHLTALASSPQKALSEVLKAIPKSSTPNRRT